MADSSTQPTPLLVSEHVTAHTSALHVPGAASQRVLPQISSLQQGSSQCCVCFGVPVPRFSFFLFLATSNPTPDMSVEDYTNTRMNRETTRLKSFVHNEYGQFKG